MQERIRLKQVLIVEGKYDATALAGLVDGLILTTDGFSIFADEEKKALIRRLGAERGLVILTDSDAAGFRIRHYIEKIATGCNVKNAYIPAVYGKERRKVESSKEGMLGVEGLPPDVLRKALQDSGVQLAKSTQRPPVTTAELYEWGLSGTPDAAQRRRALLARLGLPPRLSTRALCQVLGSLYTHEELVALVK